MSELAPFEPVRSHLAAAAWACEPGAGEALTLPVPLRSGDAIHLTVLRYGQPVSRVLELVVPPSFRVLLDAETGGVLDAGPCEPRDFGVLEHAPGRRIEGFGLGDVSGEEFWRALRRLETISPSVWEAFRDRLSPPSAEAREYLHLFLRTTYAPLLPYYRAVAPEFFRWLEETD